MKRIMIITLYSGESQYSDCMESIRNQVGDFKVDSHCIEWLPKYEAHKELFAIIDDKSDRYDYFLKFDADMVFERSDSLQKMLNIADEKKVSLTSFQVKDYMTGRMIWSVNLYRGGMLWGQPSSKVFTDQPTELKGRTHARVPVDPNESLVSHASDPDTYQSFCFGIHRASKIVQKDSLLIDVGKSYAQYKVLRDVYQCFSEGSDVHKYALAGAYLVLKKDSAIGFEIDKASYKELLQEVDCSEIDFEYFNGFLWVRVLQAVGAWRAMCSVGKYAVRKLIKKYE